MPAAVAVLVSEDTTSSPPYPAQIVIACADGSSLRAQDLLRPLLSHIQGKGGGDATLAQGGGTVTPGGGVDLLAAARALIVAQAAEL